MAFNLENSRTQAMKQAAAHLKMKFQEKDDFGLYRLLKDFRLFRRGHRRRIQHIIYDEMDIQKKQYIFDYQYTISTNNSKKTYHQTVLFINSKHLGLPQFSLQPEQVWHRLTTWMKLERDIDFDSHEDFSKSYLLKGEDEEIIRHVFNPEVLNFFTIHKNWYMEGINYYLIFYSRNERFHPSVLAGLRAMGRELHDLFEVHPDALKLDP
jgi:hypothetical protein